MPAEYEYVRYPMNRVMANDFLEMTKEYYHVYLSSLVNVENILGYMDKCETAGVPVPFSAVLLKGLGLVVRDHPEARTMFFGPPPRLVRYDACTGTMPVEREVDGEMISFLAHIKDCDSRTIRDIAFDVRRFRTAPLDEIPEFGWMMAIARLPRPVRRAIYLPFRHLPFLRTISSGIFGYAELGVAGVDDYLPLAASTVTFGVGALKERPVAENGSVVARRTIPLTMMFDRRALDDIPAARIFEECINRLESAEFTKAG